MVTCCYKQRSIGSSEAEYCSGFFFFFCHFGENKTVHGVQRGGNYLVARHWVAAGPFLSNRHQKRTRFELWTTKQSQECLWNCQCCECLQSQDEQFCLRVGKARNSCTFPSVQSALNDHAPASGALGRGTEKYSQLVSKLGQEFHDLDKLEPTVLFTRNPFIQVDMTCISEQLSEAFNMNVRESRIEILSLQTNI